MNNWSVIFATAIIFGAGVLTGGFLVNRVEQRHSHNIHRQENASASTNNFNSLSVISLPPTNPPPAHPHLPEFMNHQFLQRLNEELHLTPDQRTAIHKIITDGQNLMHKTMQDARLEIREQLTPDQRKIFDELVKRHRPNPSVGTNAPSISAPAKSKSNSH